MLADLTRLLRKVVNLYGSFRHFEDQDLPEIIVEAFHHLFESPLALLKKSDSVEEWKVSMTKLHLLSSLNHRFLLLPKESTVQRSSSGKSVTIDGDSNEVRLLSRARYFGTTNDDESTGNPLKRSASAFF